MSDKKIKHYTPTEKSLFLQILVKYKHVIENKKSNINTLREKEVAWEEICKEYNNSSCIVEERSIQQLKKLWTNLKQTQRDALTKEKQARFLTGGGPEVPSCNIDPDIALIAPNLMLTAPAPFTSNEKNIQIIEMEQSNEEISIVEEEEDVPITTNISQKRQRLDINEASTSKVIILEDGIKERKKVKRMETEEEFKLQRLSNLIKQEEELTEAKFNHEKNIMKLEEESMKARLSHERKMAEMKERHLAEMNEFERKALLAKVELSQLLLEKEKYKSERRD